MECSICNGEWELLGTLGNRDQFRCRACGMIFSVPRDDDEALAAEADAETVGDDADYFENAGLGDWGNK